MKERVVQWQEGIFRKKQQPIPDIASHLIEINKKITPTALINL